MGDATRTPTGEGDASATGLTLLMTMPTDDPTAVRITLVDVHRIVTELHTTVTSFIAAEQAVNLKAKVDRIDERVQKLERWKAALPVSAVLAAGSAVAAIVVAVTS